MRCQQENMGATYLEIMFVLIRFVWLFFFSGSNALYIKTPWNVSRLTHSIFITINFFYFWQKQKSKAVLILVLVCIVSLCVTFYFFYCFVSTILFLSLIHKVLLEAKFCSLFLRLLQISICLLFLPFHSLNQVC